MKILTSIFVSCFFAIIIIALTAAFVCWRLDAPVNELWDKSARTEFEMIDATKVSNPQIADYQVMRKIDPILDGTNRSTYFVYDGKMIKADHITWDVFIFCTKDHSCLNRFAVYKRDKDRFYTLIRVNYVESHPAIYK